MLCQGREHRAIQRSSSKPCRVQQTGLGEHEVKLPGRLNQNRERGQSRRVADAIAGDVHVQKSIISMNGRAERLAKEDFAPNAAGLGPRLDQRVIVIEDLQPQDEIGAGHAMGRADAMIAQRAPAHLECLPDPG